MTSKLLKSDYIFSGNLVFAQELYQQYLQNPDSVDANWQEFFKNNQDDLQSIISDSKGPSWAKRKLRVIGGEDFDISAISKREKSTKKSAIPSGAKELDLRVANLILAYRRFAHLGANLDPLGLSVVKLVPEISLNAHGISEDDLNKQVQLNGVLGFEKVKISDVIDRLEYIYKSKIGSEFEYIADAKQKEWLANNLENISLQELSAEEKVKILKETVRTAKFEQFLHKRFPGAKRFSVEGGDSSINSIEKIIDVSARSGVKKVVFGMAHRGRLNVLTGVMGKPYHQMIAEFQGTPGIPESVTKSGDVKYHMGYSNVREIEGNKVEISLAFNPSHLEAVNPVVTGRIRAKQDQYKDTQRNKALAVLIHGDAAFAGQGSVAENLMMNGIEGYNTGGVMHIIVNNQVGFTANPSDSRSTTYASDLAKAIDAPIFHINGDDVESVVKVTQLAMQFRQEFGKDVVLDIICYRKYGHNEGDEPLYTQPVMYGKVKQMPTLEEIYAKNLIDNNVVKAEEYQKIVSDFEAHLSAEFDKAAKYKAKEADWLKKDWSQIENNKLEIPETGVDAKKLKEYISKITEIPQDFKANSKIIRQLKARKDIVDSGENIDWGTGEALAFSALLSEGYPIRITGQDSGRGTFSHRHSVLHDGTNGNRYYPFNNLGENAANYEVHDSVLSEYAVLGFEYGYSLSSPYTLTIWEAQFGDFANGAQIIFDQFIASSEVKWLRKSGLVMLLPHGYEGQGPEHSSARLERYLQACADNNIYVANLTTPANLFHALRRQLYSKDRKPLVIMTPKSLLRNKLAVSKLADFSGKNKFQPVISEAKKLDAKVKKVIICSGKVYYDLYEARESKNINDVAIIRLEQFYPFPEAKLKLELAKYKNAEIIWCQEEPKNMGGWHFVTELLENTLIAAGSKVTRAKYVGRVACASTATGYASYHAKEQKALIDEALK